MQIIIIIITVTDYDTGLLSGFVLLMLRTDLQWKLLHDAGEQRVLLDVELAASSEPDDVSGPAGPSAKGQTPGLAPVAPPGFTHLHSRVKLWMQQVNFRFVLGLYLTVCLHIHTSIHYERPQVDVGLGRDSASFPRLPNHTQTSVEAPFVVELPQEGLAVHLGAMLHVSVATHQALHVPHVKLLQLWKTPRKLECVGAVRATCNHVKSSRWVYVSLDLQVFPHEPRHVTGTLLQGYGDHVGAGQTSADYHHPLACLTHYTHRRRPAA